jgi:hypothetical protein
VTLVQQAWTYHHPVRPMQIALTGYWLCCKLTHAVIQGCAKNLIWTVYRGYQIAVFWFSGIFMFSHKWLIPSRASVGQCHFSKSAFNDLVTRATIEELQLLFRSFGDVSAKAWWFLRMEWTNKSYSCCMCGSIIDCVCAEKDFPFLFKRWSCKYVSCRA